MVKWKRGHDRVLTIRHLPFPNKGWIQVPFELFTATVSLYAPSRFFFPVHCIKDHIHLIRNVCLRHRDLLNYRMYLFKTDIFRKFIFRHCWRPPLFLLIQSQKRFEQKSITLNIECCLKRRPRKDNIFHVIPSASAWGRTVDLNVSFVI
jgi:hypothetical protein